MKQVTVLSLRWPYAIMGILMAVPMLLPSILLIGVPGGPRLEGSEFWFLFLIATALFTGWFCLSVVPIVRRRRLIFTDQGVTLDTVWRQQHWAWESVAGLWSLGGYKPHLEVNLGSNKPKRIFLGSYWPGDTAGLAKVISEFRAQLDGAADQMS